MTLISTIRRIARYSTFALLAASGLAVGSANAAPRFATLTVFGDSYSRPGRPGGPNWVDQLIMEKQIIAQNNFAEDGSLATTRSSRNYQVQLDRWLASGPVVGPRDAFAVYLGHNDFQSSPSMSESSANFNTITDTVISRANGRPIYVLVPHDWSRNPGMATANKPVLRARVLEWRNLLIAYAKSRKNIVIVDVFTAFEKLFASPAKYGFTNITTADPAKSSSTALWYDANHPGSKGYDFIRKAVEPVIALPYIVPTALTLLSGYDGPRLIEVAHTLALPSGSGTLPMGLAAFMRGQASPAGLIPASFEVLDGFGPGEPGAGLVIAH